MARPLYATVVLLHAAKNVLREIPAAFVITWPWLLGAAVTSALPIYLAMTSGVGEDPADPLRGVGQFSLAVFFVVFIFGVQFSSIAVNWHRYLLLGEWPIGWKRLRLDKCVWRYFGNWLLISLIVSLIVFISVVVLGGILALFGLGLQIGSAALPVDGIPGGLVGEHIVALIYATLVGGLTFRFALKLPAGALGRDDFGLGASWRHTKGQYPVLALIAAGDYLIATVFSLMDSAIAVLLAFAASPVGFSIGLAV